MSNPKILIIERDEYLSKYCGIVLDKHGEILAASDGDEAMQRLDEHPDIAVILMTSRLWSRDSPDTFPLIKRIRAHGYRGPMIAMSSDPKSRKHMIVAGCTHEYARDGLVIERIVTDILSSGSTSPLESGFHEVIPRRRATHG